MTRGVQELAAVLHRVREALVRASRIQEKVSCKSMKVQEVLVRASRIQEVLK